MYLPDLTFVVTAAGVKTLAISFVTLRAAVLAGLAATVPLVAAGAGEVVAFATAGLATTVFLRAGGAGDVGLPNKGNPDCLMGVDMVGAGFVASAGLLRAFACRSARLAIIRPRLLLHLTGLGGTWPMKATATPKMPSVSRILKEFIVL